MKRAHTPSSHAPRPRLAAAAALLMLMSAVACVDDTRRDPSLVDSLRILAVKAEPPEVSAGDKVALEILAVDPLGRDLTIEWFACLQPEPGFGLFGAGAEAGASGANGYAVQPHRTCADEDAVRRVVLGTGPTAALTIPADFLDDPAVLFAGLGLPPDLELPELALQGLLAIAGINMTVFVRVIAGDDVVETVKRVNVSLSGDPNENPRDLAFDLVFDPSSGDGPLPEPLDATPPGARRCFVGEDSSPAVVSSGDYRISALNVPDPPPLYTVLVGGETGDDLLGVTELDEDLFYSFFTDMGAFDDEVIKSSRETTTIWHVGEVGPEDARLWIVVRDGRGGTDWCASSVKTVVP